MEDFSKKVLVKGERNYWCWYRTAFDDRRHPVCRAGIDYNSKFRFDKDGKIIDGYMEKIPCLGKPTPEMAAKLCPKYKHLTDEQAAESSRRTELLVENVLVVRQHIAERIEREQRYEGTLPCPVCEVGTVRYTVSRLNGHVMAACDTQGCVAWRE